ncbi:MAG: hypothetical protein IKA13_04520 [Bacteroidales bacterium]|nr:hypothetical protein [Bacteroidales bacterium]
MKAKLIIIISAVIAIASCEKLKSDTLYFSENTIENTTLSDFEIALTRNAVIGKKLPNPYKVDVMNEALRNLQTKSDLGNVELKATHHYIMFKPENHEHYRSLIMQDDIDLNSFPLDHEISSGLIVVDPNPAYSTNGYSHKWTYVPIDRDLSNIDCPYEILYDIVSFDEETAVTKSSNISEDIFNLIEQEAHSLCGMELERVPQTKTKTTPSGNIKYYDSSYDRLIGCNGMTVKAQRLTKKAYGHCDDNGNFTCDKDFTYKWTYTVFWGRTDFEIREGTQSTEEISLVFTKQDAPLNLTFDNRNDSNQYKNLVYPCEILRAACQYYYGDIDNLNRPPMKDEIKDRIYIRAVRGRGTENGFFQEMLSLKSTPYIHIYEKDKTTNNRQSSNYIYFATIHELAHASHWVHDFDNYIHPIMMLNVQESFANGVGWHLTKKVHPNFEIEYDNMYYTGIVEDMIDNDGHKANNETIPEYVSGYSIQEVENAVYGAWTYAMWENNLNSLYPNNDTRIYLDDLFDIW